MKRLLAVFALFVVEFLLPYPIYGKTTKANQTHHTIHASARPFKAVGHVAKAVTVFSFDVFDATVIDPIGVNLQGVADFLDMAVANPLEQLPEPFETIGDGVHYVYEGIDAVGTQLAK